MKNIAKRSLIVLMVIAAICSVFAFVACNDSNKNIYTVKVVGVDGQPYTSALVQPCEVSADGTLSTCYNGVATDENGVATLEIGKHITNEQADHMEIHLLGLPVYLTYEAPRMHKGETVTITLKEKLSTAKSGTGVGGYTTDILGNTMFDQDIFDPYVVGEGAYRLKFTSADQKIYYSFDTEDTGIYKVYSAGNVDASVTQLLGTKMTTIYNPNDDEYKNDNVSATDKNFSYEFNVGTADINQGQDTAQMYFEIALENSADVNKDAIIVFEYVDEYVEEKQPDTVNVSPANALSAYGEQTGTYTDVKLDGTVTYAMGDDGYYHIGSKTGNVIVATLGTDTSVNQNHVGPTAPRGYSESFTQMAQTVGLNISLDNVIYNYLPLVTAYTEKSNSEGRYPVTEELKLFLDRFINHSSGAKIWVEGKIGTLPAGDEWLWACGYYDGEQAGGPDGSFDKPYMLEEGNNTITIPANGTVYYTASTKFKPQLYTITSDNTNIKLKAYEQASSDNADVVESTAGGFNYEFTVNSNQEIYYLAFSTKDGAAGSYTVKVVISDPQNGEADEGTEDNPYVITELKTYTAETKEVPSQLIPGMTDILPVYYTYKVPSDMTLYFAVGEDTALNVWYVGENDVPVSKSLNEYDNELATGWELEADTVLIIEVSNTSGEAGTVEFTISDKIILTGSGTEEDPYYLIKGHYNIEIDVPEGGSVYFAFYTKGAKYSGAIISYNENAKLTSAPQQYLEYGNVDEYDEEEGMLYVEGELEAQTLYYFVFSTVDGKAHKYTAAIYLDEADDEPDGSEDNPFVIDGFGPIYGETTESDWEGNTIPVYYIYTVTAEDEVLYFYLGDNTVIKEISYYDSNDIYHDFNITPVDGLVTVDLANISAGTVLKIIVSTEDELGEFEFGIYNALKGSKNNPYVIYEVDDIDIISVAANSWVVYTFMPFVSVEYKFTSTSNNVKAKWYEINIGEDGEEVEGEEHTVSSVDEAFTLTISVTAMKKYYIEFTSVSGEAAEYTVNLEIIYPEGSEENPKKVTSAGTVNGTTKQGPYGAESVYYSYTVTVDCTVFITAGENTNLVVKYTDENGDEQMKWYNEWEDDLSQGLVLKQGTVIKIEVSTADYTVGAVSFTITENTGA